MFTEAASATGSLFLISRDALVDDRRDLWVGGVKAGTQCFSVSVRPAEREGRQLLHLMIGATDHEGNGHQGFFSYLTAGTPSSGWEYRGIVDHPNFGLDDNPQLEVVARHRKNDDGTYRLDLIIQPIGAKAVDF